MLPNWELFLVKLTQFLKDEHSSDPARQFWKMVSALGKDYKGQ